MKKFLPVFLCFLCASARGDEPNLPKVPSELKIELVAQYPEIEAPTAVCAAPDGRIFVGCDPLDMRLNSDKPEDWIVAISGSGSTKKVTKFADKLYAIMGLVWHRDALYVVHKPYLTVLRDTDGDGVADQRENLIEGLGPPPTGGLNDHIPSGFTLGMDGYFYISIGDKGVHAAKAKDGSTAQLYGGGILRVRVDGSDLEVFSTGTRNHLEVALDAEDHAFTRDNTDDGNGWWTRLTHHIEGGYYGYPFDFKYDPTNGLLQPGPQKPQPAAGVTKVNELFLPAMTDFGGGSPTGGLVYLSDGLPENYRGVVFFCEWGKSVVAADELERDGATFKLKKDFPLIERGKAGEFRPLMMSVAADGSLLVTDWQHGGWKANQTVGRVWRLYWPEAKPAPRISEKAPLKDQIIALGHPDRDQRLRAQWACIAEGEKAIAPLEKVLAVQTSPPVAKFHALWALDGIAGEVAKNAKGDKIRLEIEKNLHKTLRDPDPTVRAQAIRALGIRRIAATGPAIGQFLLNDNSPLVRLRAAIALGRIGDKSTASTVVSALGDEDRWVRYSVRKALKRIRDWQVVAPALTSSDERIREQAWLAISREYDETAVKILADVAQKNSDGKLRQRALELLAEVSHKTPPWDGHWFGTQPVKGPPPAKTVAWAGTPIALQALGTALTDADPALRIVAAKGLSQSKDHLPAVRARLAAETDTAVRIALVSALGELKDAESVLAIEAILKDAKTDESLAREALAALEKIGNDAAKAALTAFISQTGTPAALLVRGIDAVATLKISVAATPLVAQLRHKEASVRIAAAKALGKITAKDSSEPLIAVLKDSNLDVQKEAMKALGATKAKTAVPALIERAKEEAVRLEATMALAAMPDVRALSLYVTGMTDRSRELREASSKALQAIKDEALPEIERLIAAGQIPETALADFESALYTGVIAQWKIIGPFDNDWDKPNPTPHAVQAELLAAIAADKTPDFSKTYDGLGKKVQWRDEKAEPVDGQLQLNARFTPDSHAQVFAYAEIEATGGEKARLLCGSDDQIAIWLNGEKIHEFAGNRGFEADHDQVNILLRHGKNRLLVKCGNTGGGWAFGVRIPGMEKGRFVRKREQKQEDKLRDFALINKGNATNGEKIFFEAKGAACFQCHVVTGKGTAVGPDLSDIAAKYPRAELVDSILDPSKRMATGYEPSVIQTADGETYSGVIKSETPDSILLIGSDRQPLTIAKKDIKTRSASSVSIMPTGLVTVLKPNEFADLIAYIETLRGGK